MVAVTSLDSDLRRLRLDKYTPAAANEARSWIESVLDERLGSGDLLDALKDGVALCRLANLAIAGGQAPIRFKPSALPFVQMENISHFLRVCQLAPLNLQQHDVFLTVDLYEAKDPAQVLQCLGAFSRAAHRVNPAAFPSPIGPRDSSARGGSIMSPQSTGSVGSVGALVSPTSPPRLPLRSSHSSVYGAASASSSNPAASSSFAVPSSFAAAGRIQPQSPLRPTKTGDSTGRSTSPSKSPSSVSTWSKRDLEGSTAPAWNIAQYGYMGGASQGNLGISFGGRRQITSAGPHVPNAAEKERLRREQEAQEAQAAKEAQEEEERRRQQQREEQAAEEERRWQQETQRVRTEEKRKAEEERRRWEEEERQWQLTEEKRRREEAEAEARLAEERLQRLQQRTSTSTGIQGLPGGGGGGGDPRLRGQFLSQYQAEEAAGAAATQEPAAPKDDVAGASAYSDRVRELEMELEKARQREQEYQRERKGRRRQSGEKSTDAVEEGQPPSNRARSRSRAPAANASTSLRARSRSRPSSRPPSRQDSWSRHEPEVLRTPRSQSRHRFADVQQPPQQQPNHLALSSPMSSPPTQNSSYENNYENNSMPPPTSPRPLPDPRTTLSPRALPLLQQQPQVHQQYMHKVRTHRTGERSPPDQTGANSNITSPPLPAATMTSPAPSSSSIFSSPLQALRAHRTGEGPNKLVKSHGRPLPSPQQPQQQPQQPQQLPRQQQSPPTPAQKPGWAGKSLLEREMEMERQRQREWEEAQKETAAVAAAKTSSGSGPVPVDGLNGRWDVSQWGGFTGGDSQNRGNQGIGAGRRQIVGPRPLPGQR